MPLAIDVRERQVIGDMVAKELWVGDTLHWSTISAERNGRGLDGARPSFAS
jgi:hypothetical protein